MIGRLDSPDALIRAQEELHAGSGGRRLEKEM